MNSDLLDYIKQMMENRSFFIQKMNSVDGFIAWDEKKTIISNSFKSDINWLILSPKIPDDIVDVARNLSNIFRW